jgi:peptidoglycan/LPS O-acetylase OafA/YrhL
LAKIDNLTGIRGFAALWVVSCHFQITRIVSSVDLGSIARHGSWGVDVFFVLSGLILAINYAPRFALGFHKHAFTDFALKRFFRVYPLHFVTFLVTIPMWAVMARGGREIHGTIYTFWSGICNVLMIHAWGFTQELSWNFPSWSISAEWFAYLLIFPVCVVVLAKKTATQCAFVATVSWIILVCYVFAVHGGDLAMVRTDGVLRIIPEFVAGYATYRLLTDKQVLIAGDAMMAAGAIGLLALIYSPDYMVFLLLPLIAILLAGLYAGGRVTDAIFGNTCMVFLGEISYSIYMTHVMVMSITNKTVKLLSIDVGFSRALIVLCVETIATVGVGFLAYRLVEVPARTSLLAWVSKRARKPAVPAVTLERAAD